MVMKLEITFDRPLDTQARLDLKIALGSLAKCERIVLDRDGRGVRVMGEAMSVVVVTAALREHGFEPTGIVSSLEAEEDLLADEQGGPGERFRPLGR